MKPRRTVALFLCLIALFAPAPAVFAEAAPPQNQKTANDDSYRNAPPKRKRSTPRPAAGNEPDFSEGETSLLAGIFKFIVLANASTTYGAYPYADGGYVFSMFNPLRTDKFWTLDAGIGGYFYPGLSSGGTKIEFCGNFLPFIGILTEGYFNYGAFSERADRQELWTQGIRAGLTLPVIQSRHTMLSFYVQYISMFLDSNPLKGYGVGMMFALYPVKPLSLKCKATKMSIGGDSYSEWEVTAGVMSGRFEYSLGGLLLFRSENSGSMRAGITGNVRVYF